MDEARFGYTVCVCVCFYLQVSMGTIHASFGSFNDAKGESAGKQRRGLFHVLVRN